MRAILATGSNLGDKAKNLQVATQLLSEQAGQLLALSGIYQTEAWGIHDQPEFYNQALIIDTSLAPHDLLEAMLSIERQMGRERRIKWGERLIDLDILFYEDLVLQTPDLQIPHPFLQARNFVLQPLLEIAPDFVHPIFQKDIQTLAAECPDPLSVVRVSC
jgi:2-amino-4-hydroxy-6-hydroxymethyldihydropteridine diphosphokinase